ncbi:MAG: Hsp20 family protein [Candidatus Acidiferrales bacterium]|jgi:HSP20 family protein
MIERSTATQTALEPTQVKIVEPRTLLERFNKLSEQVSRRAYEIFEGRGKTLGQDLEDWLKAESEILHPVQLRIAETDEEVTVKADVPGFSAKDLEVSLEPWRLTISGKKETKEEQEQCSEQLLRVVDLPPEVDSGKATATLKNGILEINIPKIPVKRLPRVSK